MFEATAHSSIQEFTMRKPLTALLPLCAALVWAGALSGQSLRPGTWTGTLAPPDGPPAAVTFQVAGIGDSISITMTVPDMGVAPFSQLRVVSGKLSFQWQAGDKLVKCELTKQENGSYKGSCVDDDNKAGTIEMIPPSKP
jgi:hypothetical protein